MTHPSVLLTTTHAYRSVIAQAAATGGAVPAINVIAIGSGTQPYSPEADTALAAELLRLPASAEPDGPVVTVRTTLSGAHVGDHVVREIGVFTDSGVLVARRTIKPLELELFAELDIEMTFEY